MTVSDTIEKAERWLSKLSIAYEKRDQTEINDLSSMLLIIIRSIPEHLLEDFNQKFGLGIPLDNRKFHDEFKKRSAGQSKQFFYWYNDELKKYRYDSKLKILMNKRNIEMHRKLQKPEITGLRVKETMTSFSHITIIPAEATDDEIRIIKEKANIEIEKKAVQKRKEMSERYPTKIIVDYYFNDLPDINVLESSKLFLDAMKLMVKTAYEKF